MAVRKHQTSKAPIKSVRNWIGLIFKWLSNSLCWFGRVSLLIEKAVNTVHESIYSRPCGTIMMLSNDYCVLPSQSHPKTQLYPKNPSRQGCRKATLWRHDVYQCRSTSSMDSLEQEGQWNLQPFLRMQFTLISMRAEDSGIYVCEGVNLVGKDRKEVKLIVQGKHTEKGAITFVI